MGLLQTPVSACIIRTYGGEGSAKEQNDTEKRRSHTG
jgi:hypothetical protein